MIRSEALDIVLESKGAAMWWTLSGHFHNEQVPNIREKIIALINDGCRAFVVDLEKVTNADDTVVPMFLELLNMLKGKGGEIKFIFKNDTLCRAFLPYFNLFTIYPDADALTKNTNTLFGILKKRSGNLRKKTGFRISRSVALFMLIVLCGWFLTLLYIINIQGKRVQEQQYELLELGVWKTGAEIELDELKGRLQPLEQLGIIPNEPTAKRR